MSNSWFVRAEKEQDIWAYIYSSVDMFVAGFRDEETKCHCMNFDYQNNLVGLRNCSDSLKQ